MSQAPTALSKDEYKAQLHGLQVELVKLQRHVIETGQRLLVIFEGRDAGGKDGTIKRITEHLSPRETRVVALGKPSEVEQSQWYFQRYVSHLPAAGEIVLFNRSWYNRAGVEKVMGFCTPEQHRDFLEMVPHFEQMLVKSGIILIKYYLDISREVQARRLDDRRTDPLKQWKISPIDAKALELWDAYSAARNEMLAHTHTPLVPWNIAKADVKRLTRLAVIRDILSKVDYKGRDASFSLPWKDIVFPFDEAYLSNGHLAP